MDILELKKQSNKRLEDLQKKINSKFESSVDERFWKLSYDKTTKVGSATIRFLGPAKSSDGSPEQLEYQIRHSHYFKVNNKFYVEACPTTIGNKCPVCDANSETYKNNKSAYKSERSRRTSYFMNILVINDPEKPENNGKVFLYQCPKVIFNKIQDQISPKYADQKPVNVFDMWEGADFKIRTMEKGGFLNYDNSTFESSKPIFEDVNNSSLYDALWNKLYSLKEFGDASNFKPYSELERLYLDVVKGVSTSSVDNLENHERVNSKSTISDEDEEETPWVSDKTTSQETTSISEEEYFEGL